MLRSKAIILLISILIVAHVSAQKKEYRDILEARETLGIEGFYAALLEFQEVNTEFPNVYFQLGNINREFFANVDPLVDRQASRQYIHNSKISYGLVKLHMDESEAAHNYERYGVSKIKDRDSLIATVYGAIDDSLQAVTAYSIDYTKLVEHYDRAVTHYLASREVFIAINSQADNLRSLFLMADDQIKEDLSTVGISFDSAVYHLHEYAAIYERMPHRGKRNVQVSLKVIDHYRMFSNVRALSCR